MTSETVANGNSAGLAAAENPGEVVGLGVNGGSIISTPRPNPSLQATADHRLKQVDTPVLEPNHGEVLLHIKATGICG